MNYLIYAVVVLSGGLFYFIRKSDALSGLMNNFKLNTKLQTIDEEISKNNGLLSSEEEKRREIENEKPNDSTDDLVDFFNNK